MTHYLEYVDEKSSKFWMIEVEGNSHTVTYGKIGSEGRASTKEFDSPAEAKKSAAKLVESKKKKGYVEAVRSTDEDNREIAAGDAPADNPTPVQMSTAEAQEEFEAFQSEPALTFLEMCGDATVYRGDVTSDVSDILELALTLGEEGTPIVIDGDLTLTADSVDWGSEDECNLLLVTGDLRVNHIFLSEVGDVTVQGDLYAKTLVGAYGDNGGGLGVTGTAHIDLLVATTYFMFSFDGELETGHIIGDGTYATDFTDDYISDEATNLFVPEVIDDGCVSAWELFQRRVAGKDIFVNKGEARKGAYEQEW